ncbi:MAG: hypothetical protein R3Y38_02575 [Rikenellaceae bacterium]
MYSQRITRDRKSAIVFMIDQSASMSGKIRYNSELTTKAELSCMVINNALHELILRCKARDEVYDYLDIAVLGYGGCGIENRLLKSKFWLTAPKLYAMNPKKIKVSQVREFPDKQKRMFTTMQNRWFEPRCEGVTPMGGALEVVFRAARGWCKKNMDSFPLMIINITDGECNDVSESELEVKANKIKSLATNDGEVIFLNIHISNSKSAEDVKVLFPSSIDELPELKHARLLYKLSSNMPSFYKGMISEIKDSSSEAECKAMSFNTSIDDLFSLINIGSVTISKL